MEWPIFPKELLSTPAGDWNGLPNIDGATWRSNGAEEDDTSSDEALLAALEEAFVGARGSEDRARALETMQMFLSVRRVRLLEDLVMLSLALGEGSGGGGGGGGSSSTTTTNSRSELSFASDRGAAKPTATRQATSTTVEVPCLSAAGAASSALSLEALRRELSLAQDSLPGQAGGGGGGGGGSGLGDQQPLLVLTEGGVVEQGLLQAAAAAPAATMAKGSTSQASGGVNVFFGAWAQHFGRVLVPLGQAEDGDNNGGGGNGGGGGGSRKDDREIQAARDIERDTLVVNGVLVVGREGYSAVVGRVKREFARLADPITGPERTGLVDLLRSTSAVGSVRHRDGGSASAADEGALRPSRQLENFSKLVLKAANRTESGGLSFDAIHRIMSLCPEACNGSVLVVPDSSKAEPLKITIAAEGFTDTSDTPFGPLGRFSELRDGVHAFGLCARVEAVTVYSLYSADMETIYLKLRSTFRNCIRLPLSPFSSRACEAFSDVGYRGEAGEVEIAVVEGLQPSTGR